MSKNVCLFALTNEFSLILKEKYKMSEFIFTPRTQKQNIQPFILMNLKNTPH